MIISRGSLVTIAIVTCNRREELVGALSSALAQEGPIEVLVIDDGSTDGTARMVREEFPAARLERFDEPAGIAVRRNDATEAARGDVILSIDDDAVFTSPATVRDTLRDFDHPRVAAVAIPYIDVKVSPEEHQRAPRPDGRWATAVFRATAYAIRRDVLSDVGGFGRHIFHQGEEWDLALRMLDAGHLIRLGRAAPIHHLTSPHRSLRVMDLYGRRNEMLISWMYFPAPWNVLYMIAYAARGLLHGIRVGRPRVMVRGIAAGMRACSTTPRRPIGRHAWQVERRMRRAGAISVAEAERVLAGRRDHPNLS